MTPGANEDDQRTTLVAAALHALISSTPGSARDTNSGLQGQAVIYGNTTYDLLFP